MSTPGQLLLVICAFLCLIPGDALLCSQCVAPKEGEPCEMENCEVDDSGRCLALIIYKGEDVFEKLYGCTRKDDINCDTTHDDPEDGMKYKFSCCDDSDLCNSKTE